MRVETVLSTIQKSKQRLELKNRQKSEESRIIWDFEIEGKCEKKVDYTIQEFVCLKLWIYEEFLTVN